MSAAKLRKNDMVVVLTGEDKGKVAPIIEINYSKQSVILKGINKKTKHFRLVEVRSHAIGGNDNA